MSLKKRTWIEIDRKALKINYQTLRSLLPKDCCLMAVVKSNAYGHNIIEYSKILDQLGANWFGVDSLIEGLALRRAGIKKPILVLGYTFPENFKLANDNKISITISSFDSLEKLQAFESKIKGLNVHLKVDTGMHRQGFQFNEIARLINKLKKLKNTNIEAFYTHLASSKNPKLSKEADQQIEKFNVIVKNLEKNGFILLKHASASGGAFFYPKAHFDMVRIGAALYGLWPSEEIKVNFAKSLELSPILSWKTILSEIKVVDKGERIGYDFTETLKRKTLVGICPVGYWHGIPRSISSKGHFLVNGKRAKILGRISMDIITIDLTDIKDSKVGNIVTIIGRDGKECITPDEMAQLAGTINYEIVTRINPLIERIYIN